MWDGRSLTMVLTHGAWALHHGSKLGHASLVEHSQVMTSFPKHVLHLLWPICLEHSKGLVNCEHACALLEERSFKSLPTNLYRRPSWTCVTLPGLHPSFL